MERDSRVPTVVHKPLDKQVVIHGEEGVARFSYSGAEDLLEKLLILMETIRTMGRRGAEDAVLETICGR